MKSQDAKRLVILAVLTVWPWACSPRAENETARTTPPPEEHALVRFVNATAYTQPIDVYMDEAKLLLELSKDKVTEYSEWPAKKHEIALRVEGNLAATAKKSESLDSGKQYTVVGFSKVDGTPAVSIFTDSFSMPETGKARIRLIHVADGAAELGVFPSGTKESFLDGVSYNDESSADVDPGPRTLEVRKEGERIVALKLPQIDLEAGKIYTIVVAADQDHKLHAIKVDSATPVQQGLNR